MRTAKIIITVSLVSALLIGASVLAIAEEIQLKLNFNSTGCNGHLNNMKVELVLEDFYKKYQKDSKAVKVARKEAVEKIIEKSKEILRKKMKELASWGRIQEAQRIAPIEERKILLTEYSFSKGKKMKLTATLPTVILEANICFK